MMSVRLARMYNSILQELELPGNLSRHLRRADDFIRLGVVAAHNVLHESEILPAAGSRTGLFLGTAFGPMQTNFDVLDQVVEKEPVSPTLFSHSVFNAAAGYMASVLGIYGSAITFTDFGFPFFRSLEQGLLAIKAGCLDYCLVLQIETYSDLLLDARTKSGPSVVKWQPGVVCWLLAADSTQTQSDILLEGVQIAPSVGEHESWLQLEEQVTFSGGQSASGDGFLGAAASITAELESAESWEDENVVVKSLYGSVKLVFA